MKVTQLAGGVAIAVFCSCDQKPAPIQLDTQQDRESFSIGYSMGKNISQGLAGWGDGVDVDVLLAGIRAVLEEDPTPAMTEGEIQQVIAQMKGRKQAQGDSMRSIATVEGDAYLANYATEEGVVTLDSGIHYKVLKSGDGATPGPDDTVVAHYAGRLIDGTEFDSSYKRNNPSEFSLKRVIKGWQEVVQLMPVGSKWEVAIPAHLAYGDRAKGNIPAHSALIFEIELLDIK